MKVSMETIKDPSFWEKAGVRLPRFDIAAMREKTKKELFAAVPFSHLRKQ